MHVTQKRNPLWTEIDLQPCLFFCIMCVFYYNVCFVTLDFVLGARISNMEDEIFSILLHVRTEMDNFKYLLPLGPGDD